MNTDHTLLQTPFWYEQPTILLSTQFMFEIFPSRKYDVSRKMNALVRLSIYYAIIMYVYQKNRKYLFIPLISLGLTWIIYHKQTDNKQRHTLKQSINDQLSSLVKLNDLQTECRIPVKNNPFMNPSYKDFGSDKPTPPKSCPSYNNVGVQRRVEELFNEDLYRESQDIFGKNNSQRQFYTVPGNNVPNDQGSFAQWLYGTPPTCKEGNAEACLGMGGIGGGHQNSHPS